VSDKTFQEWCIVELFGHSKVAGLVTEQSIGGCWFVRVDVPASEGQVAMTKFYGQGAIYCMTPVTEDLARRAAVHFAPRPVSEYDLPRALPPVAPAPLATELKSDDDEGDDFPDDEDEGDDEEET
jgi:hypothetical protein